MTIKHRYSTPAMFHHFAINCCFLSFVAHFFVFLQLYAFCVFIAVDFNSFTIPIGIDYIFNVLFLPVIVILVKSYGYLHCFIFVICLIFCLLLGLLVPKSLSLSLPSLVFSLFSSPTISGRVRPVPNSGLPNTANFTFTIRYSAAQPLYDVKKQYNHNYDICSFLPIFACYSSLYYIVWLLLLYDLCVCFDAYAMLVDSTSKCSCC